jgi:hypothetical protein
MAVHNEVEVPIKVRLDLGPADREFLTERCAALRSYAASARHIARGIETDDPTSERIELLSALVHDVASVLAELIEKVT